MTIQRVFFRTCDTNDQTRLYGLRLTDTETGRVAEGEAVGLQGYLHLVSRLDDEIKRDER